jgi:hypothetical protein
MMPIRWSRLNIDGQPRTLSITSKPARCYGLASYTMLNGVCVALRKRVNPASLTTS